jgi:hypothetical protein
MLIALAKVVQKTARFKAVNLIQLQTGQPLYIVVWIDEQSAIHFPATWFEAIKLRWLPSFILRRWPVQYTKEYRRWHLQGIYSNELMACNACETKDWCYFPFLLNVGYPKIRIEANSVFPLREGESGCSQLDTVRD